MQQTATEEGYCVAKMVRTGKAQLIALLPPVDKNTADADDQKIIRKEAVRAISKQK